MSSSQDLINLEEFEKFSKDSKFNCIVVLGATATGKTTYAVQLAKKYNGEIISVDSRQVYRNLDLGTGKDLIEYGDIPYHLIDICDVNTEYNVFNFQQDAYKAFSDIQSRNKLPIFAGGTGLYLDAIVRKYELVPVPENKELRAGLKDKNLEELQKHLLSLEVELHNKTDLEQRERVIRAIEIDSYNKQNPNAKKQLRESMPDIRPKIIALKFERSVLRERIKTRLLQRIDDGMIEEVENLHKNGTSWERLEQLGLEYRFTAFFLQGKIETKEEYIAKLYQAICKFAKRQETWFRRMERKGVEIEYIKK